MVEIKGVEPPSLVFKTSVLPFKLNLYGIDSIYYKEVTNRHMQKLDVLNRVYLGDIGSQKGTCPD